MKISFISSSELDGSQGAFGRFQILIKMFWIQICFRNVWLVCWIFQTRTRIRRNHILDVYLGQYKSMDLFLMIVVEMFLSFVAFNSDSTENSKCFPLLAPSSKIFSDSTKYFIIRFYQIFLSNMLICCKRLRSIILVLLNVIESFYKL